MKREREEEARGGPPELVGTSIGALFERLGIAEKVERAEIANRWDDIAGPHIARVTTDARVSGRTLFVEVASAAWLNELNMRRHELLKRLNAGRERGRIEKLVFLQGGRARAGRDPKTAGR